MCLSLCDRYLQLFHHEQKGSVGLHSLHRTAHQKRNMHGTAPWSCPISLVSKDTGEEAADIQKEQRRYLVLAWLWFSSMLFILHLQLWTPSYVGHPEFGINILLVASTITTWKWFYKHRTTEVKAHHRRCLQQSRTFPCRKSTFLFLDHI